MKTEKKIAPAQLVTYQARVKTFVSLVQAGMDAWVRAGKILDDMVKTDPNAIRMIQSEHPHLTTDILHSFLWIGRKDLYPYLLADGSPGSRRLAYLPYDQQVELYHAKVVLVRKYSDRFEQSLKRVCDLTSQEAAVVFCSDRVRTANEQEVFLTERTRAQKCRQKKFREPESSVVVDLDAPAMVNLGNLLATAFDASLEIRSALAELKLTNSKFDQLIGKALGCLGEIRFAMNEGEIKAA